MTTAAAATEEEVESPPLTTVSTSTTTTCCCFGSRMHLLVVASAILLLFLGLLGFYSDDGGLAETFKLKTKTATITTTTATSTTSITTKPYFILHVGPPKSATTTLQNGLTHYKSILETNHTNIVYIGSGTNAKDRALHPLYHALAEGGQECQVQLLKARNQFAQKLGLQKQLVQQEGAFQNWSLIDNYTDSVPCWVQTQQLLQEAAQNKTSFLGSFEVWSFSSRVVYDWHAIHKALSRHFNVMIIATYRRYSDWIPSVFSQKLREGGRRPNWKDCVAWFDKTKFQMYQSMAADPGHKCKYYFTDQIQTAFEPYFGKDNIRVFNMHSPNNNPPTPITTTAKEDVVEPTTIISRFVCEMLPHADQACREIAQQEEEKPLTSANHALDFDREYMACQAYHMGVFTDSSSDANNNEVMVEKQQAQKIIQAFLQEQKRNNNNNSNVNLSELVLHNNCPSNPELEAFLDMSLEYEKKIIIATNNDNNKGATAAAAALLEDHKSYFWEKKSKYCTVNASLLFESKVWKDYLETKLP